MRIDFDGNDFGILSVLTQETAHVEVAFRVSANCFRPRPTVGSSVVRLTIKSHGEFDPIRHERFRRVVRASFAHRRKTLANSLRDEGYSPDSIARAMQAADIPAQARAEMLSLETYQRLAHSFDPDSPEG